jgi:hypothetical protein
MQSIPRQREKTIPWSVGSDSLVLPPISLHHHHDVIVCMMCERENGEIMRGYLKRVSVENY